METLAYLYTACAYEEPEAAELTLKLDRLNLKLLSSQASLLMLQLLVPVAILAVAGHASALQIGDRGAAVTSLQDQLRSAGYFDLRPTGVYASVTADAVRRFQRDQGLSVDGIAGPATQRALRGQYTTSGTIRPISSNSYTDTVYSSTTSSDVRAVQQQLNANGYSVSVDGVLGSETTNAVRRFQADHGLAVDGIPGPATRSALGLSPTTSGSAVGSGASPSTARKRYVVVVPAKNSATLSQVRTVVPSAIYSASNLGKYVYAGAFDERGYAEARATLLRANKLDAQVRYF